MHSIILCAICNLRFQTVQEKQKHYEQNHPLKYLKYCKDCDKYIFFITQLRNHSSHKKSLESNPHFTWQQLSNPKSLEGDFKCFFCPKILRSEEEREQHLKRDNCRKYTFILKQKFGRK